MNKKRIISFTTLFFLGLFLNINKVFAATTYSKVSCGNIDKIPSKIPELTSWIIIVIQVIVPIILIIISMIDLVKAMSSQKEDEIKKGQNILIKRIIIAVLIFLLVGITKLVVSVVANASDSNSISSCIDCFISNDCK